MFNKLTYLFNALLLQASRLTHLHVRTTHTASMVATVWALPQLWYILSTSVVVDQVMQSVQYVCVSKE